MSSPIAPDLVYQLKSVADPALSPDGQRLAYALSWVEHAVGGDVETVSRLTMVELDGGTEQEFTQGNKDAAPKFSPDGNLLAFLRSNGQEGRQVWVMNAAGGEARQITKNPKGVTDFGWSPASDSLVFCADVDPDRSQDPAASGPQVPQVTIVSRVRYRYDTLGWRGNAHFHLFVADIGGGEATQITYGDWDDTTPAWSPDGSRIAFISGRRDDRDLRALSEVYVMSSEGGVPGLWSQGLYSVGAVSWSPDSQRLVVVGSDAPEGTVLWQGWLYILEKGRDPVRITDDSLRPLLTFPAINRQPEIRWTDDGRVLFVGERQGESFVYQAQVDGSGAKTIWGGGLQASALTLDRSAKRAVATASSPESPGDLYQVEIDSGTAKQLSRHNAGFLQEHPSARLEKFYFERAGFSVECRLLFPPGFDESMKYPLVLDIHGGPNGAFYDSFVPVQQVLATSGKLVLAVNPRGSSTYGNDFMLAVLEDWGGEDYLDLMGAVDRVCERPYVDSERLGVHGYSYGGYMTGWAVGHTDRFRAAVSGAPCMDLYSMYGTSDIGISFGESQWGGSLVDAAPRLLEHSPITYASNVNTPVLLLHGEDDARCPIAQSEEYFTVLKRLDKVVEFVRFPGCSHAFPRLGHPRMREEYMARTLAWFDKYLV
jgi:dipeptidyl aminopeptidase/acylaminoacyl peptidase